VGVVVGAWRLGIVCYRLQHEHTASTATSRATVPSVACWCGAAAASLSDADGAAGAAAFALGLAPGSHSGGAAASLSDADGATACALRWAPGTDSVDTVPASSAWWCGTDDTASAATSSASSALSMACSCGVDGGARRVSDAGATGAASCALGGSRGADAWAAWRTLHGGGAATTARMVASAATVPTRLGLCRCIAGSRARLAWRAAGGTAASHADADAACRGPCALGVARGADAGAAWRTLHGGGAATTARLRASAATVATRLGLCRCTAGSSARLAWRGAGGTAASNAYADAACSARSGMAVEWPMARPEHGPA
jgi:hypothetical protein